MCKICKKYSKKKAVRKVPIDSLYLRSFDFVGYTTTRNIPNYVMALSKSVGGCFTLRSIGLSASPTPSPLSMSQHIDRSDALFDAYEHPDTKEILLFITMPPGQNKWGIHSIEENYPCSKYNCLAFKAII